MPIAQGIRRCARALLLATVSPGPARVAEAGAIIANAMAGAIIFALRDFAIVASEALLACACAVEAVTMVAETVGASLQATVSSIPSIVANAHAAGALAVTIAILRSA